MPDEQCEGFKRFRNLFANSTKVRIAFEAADLPMQTLPSKREEKFLKKVPEIPYGAVEGLYRQAEDSTKAQNALEVSPRTVRRLNML